MYFFLKNTFLKAVLDSQTNWAEGTESSLVIPEAPTHAQHLPLSTSHTPVYYNWWIYTDVSLLPKVRSLDWDSLAVHCLINYKHWSDGSHDEVRTRMGYGGPSEELPTGQTWDHRSTKKRIMTAIYRKTLNTQRHVSLSNNPLRGGEKINCHHGREPIY